jgi:5,10-methylenetetrahydromethanopterin reductase
MCSKPTREDDLLVDFGIGLGGEPRFLGPDDVTLLSEIVKVADGGGVRAIGTHDTSFIGGDAYVRATLIALATGQARVGLRPTNPITREPQVMAAFIASLSVLTSGRAFVDIATGDSSVKSIGRSPATRAVLEEYVTCIRELLDHGSSNFDGRPQRIQWSDDIQTHRIPITICAEGPKMLHLAGRIGDGAMCGTGLSADVVTDTKRRITAGALAAGRDPAELDVWFYAVSSMDADPTLASDVLLPQLASILHHSLSGAVVDKVVPDAVRGRLAEYQQTYHLADHSALKAKNSNVHRMNELKLTQYAADRFAVTGTASQWIERIGTLVEAGVEKLWLNLGRGSLQHQRTVVEAFVRHVLPEFS